MVLMLLSAFVLAASRIVLGCSIEINSIARTASQTDRIVAGTVDAIEGEVLFQDPEGNDVRGVSTVFFDVERVLKGPLTPGIVELQFEPELAASSCGDLLDPYKEQARLMLMIDAPDDEGGLHGPLVPPRVIRLSEVYETTPLYRYLLAVLREPEPPLVVSFEGSELIPWQQPVSVTVTVTNNLDFPVTVRMGGGSPPPADADGAALRLYLYEHGDRTFHPLVTDRDLTGPIRPGETTTASVNLGEYYTLTRPGRYGLTGQLELPTGHMSHTDNWGDYNWLWSFTTDEKTHVGPASWGRLKRR